VFIAAFGVCFWQNDVVLDIMDRPLVESAFSKDSADPLERTAEFQQAQKELYLAWALASRELAASDDVSPGVRRAFEAVAQQADAAARVAPEATPKRPVTLGVGEPFTVTVRVAAYAGLLLALPILLYQAYAFVLPAFSPRERQVALPLMALVPFLFIGGVVFAYYFVLPAAIDFLQNFNDENYDILIQARDYYKFSITVLMVMGLLFQVPIGILAVTRVGIVTTAQLRKNRRYAILVIAVLAMLLPGQDPVTMLMMMAPLLVLFEGSILLASSVRWRKVSSLVAVEPPRSVMASTRPPETSPPIPKKTRPPPMSRASVRYTTLIVVRRPEPLRSKSIGSASSRRRARARARPRRPPPPARPPRGPGPVPRDGRAGRPRG
jgi:sec-independent protein translocase protein TatC